MPQGSGPGRTDRDQPAADATEALLMASHVLVGVAVRSLAAAEQTVTLPQYRALVLLASRGAQNVGRLAEGLGIHPSTTTRLCNRLVAKGLIERNTSRDNRREVTVTLSASGRGLIRRVTARRREEIGRIVGRLDEDARRALVAALAPLPAAAGEVLDDAWKLGWTA